MAIYHLTTKVISRGKGQSAIAAAAYRSGERLYDQQAGEQKLYVARAERIEFTAIMTPKDAPEWARDRNELWNHAEQFEKRKDARLAREIEIALPHELTDQQREWLVKDFAREAFVRKGYVVDIAIHAPDKTSDERNHHAHLMVTERTLSPDGFSTKKDPSMNTVEQLEQWREQWGNLVNRHLERHGHEVRVDHRSLKDQGIDREPTIHLGYAANEMAQRGAQSDRFDALQQLLERNEIRIEMKAIDAELRGLGAGAARGGAALLGGLADTVGKGFETVANAFEGLLGGGGAPPQPEPEHAPPPDQRQLRAKIEAENVHRDEDARAARVSKYLSDYGQVVTPETERDAEIERQRRDRDGGRERTRGE